VGAAADGAEPWADQDAFARGAAIGAPPDPFSVTGQNWGLPPPNPLAMDANACSAFRVLLAANMRHAGALRIDHVMGLSRLFWIPDGGAAADGAYVDYPLDALLHGLALESTRARCLVVGEDLGTVPEGLRERLAARDILSYRVLWFERDGADFIAPARYPVRAAACVSTHDLPTVAGWWSGADIDERRALGSATDDDARLAHHERQTARAALVTALARAGATGGERFDDATGEGNAIACAIHRFVCATPSALVLLQADDLAGESMAVNLPGTDRERPNWRRKLDVDVEALWRTDTGMKAVADFASRQTDNAQPRDNSG
jgi:glycogen operon protein